MPIIDDPKVNKVVKKPDDENSKIWRYMDFQKFVSLLHKNLFLVQSCYLNDKFEGFWQKTTTAHDEYRKKLRPYTCISCWQKNESESALMWDVYPRSNNGIAIQSTFSRLRQSVEDVKNLDLYVGEVNYSDNILKLMPGFTFEPYFYKRKYFKEDNEIRILYQEIDLGMQQKTKIDFVKHGIDLKVDLDKLIESIYISPNAKKWFVDLVQSVVDKYELDKPVKTSSVGELPGDFEYNEEEKMAVIEFIPYGAVFDKYKLDKPVKSSSVGKFSGDFEYNEEEKMAASDFIYNGAAITDNLDSAVVAIDSSDSAAAAATDNSGNTVFTSNASGQIMKTGIVLAKPKD